MFVEVWKGPLKALSLDGIGFALVCAFFHYVTTTPILVTEVTEKDEEHARQLEKQVDEEARR